MATLGTLSFDTKLNAQAVKDAETIKKQVLHKLGNSIPLKLKVTFTSKDLRADLQNQLRQFKPKVKVDIIVDQAEASKAVQDALAKAGLMNNMTAGQLRAVRAAEVQQRMAIALARAQREAAAGADRHSKSIVTLNSHFGNGITIGGKFSATIANIYSLYTLKNFLQSMIEIGGEFQKQRIALETMLGSMEKANALYSQMKGLAVESPFTFMDLMSYTKQLKAFQIPYNELFETTKRLGDISAGLGVDMNRLILAFGQVRAAAFLRGQEVRQFTEAGIPLIDALAKKFSELEGRVVSAGDVFEKISKRQVSFDMVKQVLWDLTDVGGQFYNMQSKLTESLSGKLDKLKDSWQIMVAEMAQGNNAVLGGMLDILIKLVQYGDKFVGTLATLTAAYIAYKSAIILKNAAQKVSLAIEGAQLVTSRLNAIRAIQGLTSATWGQVAAQRAFNVAIKANPIGFWLSALTTVIGLFFTFNDILDDTTESINGVNQKFKESEAEINSEQAAIDLLFDRLRKAKKGTEEYMDVKSQIISQYGQYLKGLSQEIQTLENVEAAYNAVAKAARNASLARGKEAALKQTMDDYGKTYSEYIGKIRDALKKNNLRDDQINQYLKYIKDDLRQRGQVSREVEESLVKVGAGKIHRAWFGELKNNEAFLKDNTRMAEDLFGITDEVEKKASRNELWWQKASQYAGDFKMLAPKIDQDYDDYLDSIAKQLNEVQGKLQKRTKDAIDYKSLEIEKETLIDIYTKALGGNLEGLSKFKPKGGNKDKQLEAAKTKLQEYKAFLSEYKKYRETYSKEDAINILEGLFPNLKGKGAKLVDNYIEELDKLKFSEKDLVESHKKFNNDVNKTQTDTLFEREAEGIRLFSSEIELALKRISKQWENYKKILDDTGNRDLAARLSGLSGINRADAIRTMVKGLIPSKTIDFDKVVNMGDDQIEEYVKSLGLVGKKAEGVAKALKEWRDAQMELRDEALDVYGKMIADVGGLGTEIDKINEKYDEQIRKLREIKELSPEERDAREKQTERSRKLDIAELFVNNIDFGELFDMLGNYAIETAKEVKNEVDKLISGPEAKNLTQAELERYLKVQKTLSTVGGEKAISPFSKSAWSELSTATSEFQTTMRSMIDNMKDYIKAQEDEEQAIKDLTNAQSSEADMKARMNLNDAQIRKKEARVRLAQNVKDAKQQGQELSEAQKRIINGAESMTETFKQVFAGNLHDLTLGVLNIIGMIKGGKDGAGGAAQSIGAALQELGMKSGNVYGAVIAAILQILDMLKDDATGFFRELLDDVFDAVVGLIDDLFSGELIGTIVGEIVAGIGKIFQSVGSLVKNVFDGSFFTGIWDGITSAFSDDDEKQELIEQSKKQVELLQTMVNLLDKALERSLGGIYTTKASQKDISMLKSYREAYGDFSKLQNALKGTILENDSYSMEWLDRNARKAIDDAISSQSYYDTKFAELNLQKAELQRQLELEEDKKDSDYDNITDYKQQIAEMEDEIEHFAEDMAKTIYDIDVKSWASELGDALFEAWQKGEDGAEAFAKKARELLTDVSKNIITTSIIETALQPVLDAIKSEMTSKDGKLDADSISLFAGKLGEVMGWLPETVNAAYDAIDEELQKRGLGSMKDEEDKSSSSASATIKGITEQTADLLASYVNGIRADVSVIRAEQAIHLPAISVAVQRSNVIAESQVMQLQQIADNTRRNAESASQIYDLLHSLAPDGQKWRGL